MKKKTSKSNQSKPNCTLSIILFCSITLMSFSNVTLAQKKWSIEVRPDVNFATTNLGDANLKTGFGIEGTVNYRLMPHFSAYAGWGWNKFAAGQSFAGTDMDFDETTVTNNSSNETNDLGNYIIY